MKRGLIAATLILTCSALAKADCTLVNTYYVGSTEHQVYTCVDEHLNGYDIDQPITWWDKMWNYILGY